MHRSLFAVVLLSLFAHSLTANGDENYLGRTVVIPIRSGTLEDPTQFQAIETALSRAQSEGAHAVILEIDCVDAPLDKTVRIMKTVGNLPFHTHAYIVRRAGGAAALLAMSAAKIQIAPQSEISGASENAKEEDGKLIDEAVAIARKRGHRAEVARKLVDPSAELKVGERLIAATGSPLKLDVTQATMAIGREKPLYAAGLQPNISEVIDREELSRNVVRLKLDVGQASSLSTSSVP